ncbi:ABC transporter permease [Lacticaseibacillus songhuajiangensis]|jgi:hypothetical protein|uniref:ABC transporter permease n=1 Tax=Lacticaseibacillus songhuajiangensis TaxID=1296539 RepID=UPI000F7A5B63|nr:ABC transporter permease [Lacticaseibacillus songhuajiangensis]
MLRRNLIVDVCILIIAILSGLVWSSNDQSRYADLLSHGGMSESAYVYNSKSSRTMRRAVELLDQNKTLQNYQVQFAPNSKTSYFFAKGSYTGVPLLSGHMMSSADYKSTLPVAVVGKNVAAQSFSTATQKYLHRDGTYIPITGVVGTSRKNALNDHVFISASSTRTTFNPELKDVEILVDGADAQHTHILSKIFGGATPRRIISSNAQKHDNWWERNGFALLAMVGLSIATVAVGMLAAYITPRPQTSGLEGPLRNNYLRNVARAYIPGVIVALSIGTAFSWLRLYITGHFRLLLFAVFLLMVFASSNQFFIHYRSNKEEQRETA